MIGIYKIENLINHHCYIGQSVDIESRWKDECNDAFNPNSGAYDYPLSRAFRKYGIKNFSFEVLEECNRSELNTQERYWIKYYNSFFNGYNQTLGGDSTIQTKKDYIIGIIHDLETTDLYHKEIAEKWKVSTETVQGINTGRYWYQDNKEYPLQKKHKKNSYHINPITKEREETKHYCQKCGKEIASSKAIHCMECARILSRKVERPSAEELFNYLKSIKGNFLEASRHFGVSDNAIRKWCKKYNIPCCSSDYKNKKEIENSKGPGKKKAVAQLDINTLEIVAVYSSAEEAARALGKTEGSHIGAVCNGKRKTAYGYKWSFI